jgi:hypothetical protein
MQARTKEMMEEIIEREREREVTETEGHVCKCM